MPRTNSRLKILKICEHLLPYLSISLSSLCVGLCSLPVQEKTTVKYPTYNIFL
jgi:hypothetical protein